MQKDEIKEILDNIKSKYEDYYVQDIVSGNDLKLLLDYITNLQEQLHKASLDIQELTERDIECPSWCDKLTDLQEAIETIKNTNKLLIQQKAQLQDDLDMLDNRIDKAIKYITIFKDDIRGLDEVVLLDILQGKSDKGE